MAAFILFKMSDDDSFIIGELHNETEEELVLNYPIVLRLRATPQRTTNVSTSKLMPFSMNNLVSIRKRNIHSVTKPNERLIKYYIKFMDLYKNALDNILEEEIVNLQDEFDSNLSDEAEQFIEQQEDVTEHSNDVDRKGILH